MDDLSDQEILEHLPKAYVREMSSALTPQAMLRLVQRIPGEIKVPRHPSQTSQLAQVLTPQEFADLCHFSGGVTLEIPRGVALERYRTNREIIKLADQAVSCAQIAAKVGRTQRWVRTVIRRHKSNRSPCIGHDPGSPL